MNLAALHLSPADLLGLLGAALFLLAFAGVQVERLDPHGVPALTMNLAGAVLVLISLLYAFNLAAFVMESCWGLVAAYGLAKRVIRRRRN